VQLNHYSYNATGSYANKADTVFNEADPTLGEQYITSTPTPIASNVGDNDNDGIRTQQILMMIMMEF
jgi:hypothetical protein